MCDDCNILLSPLILTADLVLFLRSEVVLDVEGLANLLWRLALDHVGNGLAAHVEKSFDVEVVRSLKAKVDQFLSRRRYHE